MIGHQLSNYVAAGYFLSLHTRLPDFTGTELRTTTMAHDHTPRRFFPDSWALSWCHETREHRLAEASIFGLNEADLDKVIAWADESFDQVWGAWSVFFTLEHARAAACSFLSNALNLELWGVGLHKALVSEFCRSSAPPPRRKGYAPEGQSGIHSAACLRPTLLASEGAALGHEILIADVGCCFNSPESLHVDEGAGLQSAGAVPNSHGLIDSFDDALACCEWFNRNASDVAARPAEWFPWLIVRYLV